MTLINKIIEALEPIVAKNGQELIEATFEEHSKDKKLKVIVGSLKGPGIKELTSITKAFNKLNDERSIIPFDFNLDVSSPGLDRPLITKGDFARNLNREVSVKYRTDNDSVQKDSGVISEVSETEVTLTVNSKEIKIVNLKNIIKAKLIIKIGKRK